jgi:iron complex outermembrane receptor protein
VEDLTTTRIDVGGVGRFNVGHGAMLAVRASGVTQRHRHQFGDVREPDRHGTLFGEVALSRATTRNVWVLGAALQGERYRSSTFPAFDYTFMTPSLFAHDELQVLKRLSVAASARLDVHSEYGTFLSPRVSALVGLGGTWTARGSAGTGFFGPTPFTEETEVTGLSRLLPLAELHAESARSGALDIGGTLGPLELNATVFGSLVDHAVQLRASLAEPIRFELVNTVEETRTYGGELLARFRRGAFVVTGTYAYTRSTEPSPDAGVRRVVPLTPRHTAGLVGTFERERELRVGLEVYYTGSQALDENPYRFSSEPYVVIGALVERHIGRARVFVNVENITDVRQSKYDPLVLPVRADDGRWTTDAWAPLEGRVINGGIRLSF